MPFTSALKPRVKKPKSFHAPFSNDFSLDRSACAVRTWQSWKLLMHAAKRIKTSSTRRPIHLNSSDRPCSREPISIGDPEFHIHKLNSYSSDYTDPLGSIPQSCSLPWWTARKGPRILPRRELVCCVDITVWIERTKRYIYARLSGNNSARLSDDVKNKKSRILRTARRRGPFFRPHPLAVSYRSAMPWQRAFYRRPSRSIRNKQMNK